MRPTRPTSTSLLLLLSLVLVDLARSLPAAAEDTRFVAAIPDLPLMPALREQEGQSIVFESADGRIVEAFAAGQTDRASVVRFYEESLPQLGWIRDADKRFRREGETLTIDFPDGPAGGGIVVRFSLSPAAQ